MATSEDKSTSKGAGSDSKEAAGITTESVEARRQRWLAENREAIEDYNRWVGEHGLILRKYHLF